MKKALRCAALLLALLFLSLPLFSCSQNERAVGTVGDYEILYEELRFVTMSFKKVLDADHGDSIADNGTIWDDPVLAARYSEALRERVTEMLQQNYRVLIACEQYGIGKDVLESDEIREAVDRQIESAIRSFGSRDAFRADMESNYMTEHLYRLYLAREQMKYKLRDAVLKDSETALIRDQQSFFEWLRDGNCVYVQHVFVRNDEGEDVSTNRLIAKEISVALQNKERHIDSYVGTMLNDDLTNVSPYYLIPSVYDKALTDAGLRLYDVGDATDPIETEEGFWVLQRIEEPEGALESQIGDLFDTYLWASIGGDLSGDTEVEIVWNDFGKEIDLTQMQ